MNGYIPPGVERYSEHLHVFRLKRPRLCAGIEFTSGEQKQTWCADCIYNGGQPDESLVNDQSPVIIAMLIDDPSGEKTLRTNKGFQSGPPTCHKCETQLPVVETGDRSISREHAVAELQSY